ncbi:MAG TPA: hypothetical protein VNI02_20870 [Blastocatellia bacterium]|jgi:hypothetical protein|nr:hypothetical protein [Blastocatellia bacterium]
MTGIGKKENASLAKLRPLIWACALGAMLFSLACGGDDTPINNASQYPTGISDDIYKQLKYDARVQDYEEQGNTLVVNVNDSWMSSPPGMRERALGQWYILWQNAHGKQDDLKIVVQHEGNALDSWSVDKGYQPAQTKKKGGEAHAEG